MKKNAFTGATAYVGGGDFDLWGVTHSDFLQRVIVLH
jgi:hypothetical protein